jgi:hypothetical protein
MATQSPPSNTSTVNNDTENTAPTLKSSDKTQNDVPPHPLPSTPPAAEPTSDQTTPIEAPKQPSWLVRGWKKLGFTPTVVMIMVKPAVAATIAMAIYQRQAVARNYYNFGYLSIIIAITTVPILPRGKFLVNLMVSVVSFGSDFVFIVLRCDHAHD